MKEITIVLFIIVNCCQCYEVYWKPEILKDNMQCQIHIKKEDANFAKLEWSWTGLKGSAPQLKELERKPSEDFTNQITLSRTLTMELDNAKGLYWCNYTSPYFNSSVFLLTENNFITPSTASSIRLRRFDPVWLLSSNVDSKHIDRIIWRKKVLNDMSVNLISVSNLSRYEVVPSGPHFRVQILNADFDDVGDYNLSFESSKLGKFSDVNLNYKIGMASRELEKMGPYDNVLLNEEIYLIDSMVTAACIKQESEIKWAFKESSEPYGLNGSSTYRSFDKNQALFSVFSDGDDNFDFIQWKANVSGFVVCFTGAADMVYESRVNHVCVSDIDTRIKLDGPDNVQAGDNIKLTCKVAGCNIHGSAMWSFKGEDSGFFQTLPGNVVLSDMNSSTANLVINSFAEENNGDYVCEYSTYRYHIRESIKIAISIDNSLYFIFLVLIIILIMVLVVFAMWKCRTNKTPEEYFVSFLNKYKAKYEEYEMKSQIDHKLPLNEQTDLLPVDKKWMFPRDKLKMGKKLGSGNFGDVFIAIAAGISQKEAHTTVAVKKIRYERDADVTKSAIKEFKIMSHIGNNQFVIKLLGVSLSRHEFLLILEYCCFGCLLQYLRNHRHRFINDEVSSYMNLQPLSLKNTTDDYIEPDELSEMKLDSGVLIAWAYQISRGMEWLAARKVLHGDLATRNILLTTKNIIKICDFGLASDLYAKCEYQKDENLKLPIKWMAMESITDRIFSTQSDVWSFGVTLWEVFSLGVTPYPGFETAQQIFSALEMGYRMETPKFAPTVVYQIMLKCWQKKPSNRPTFTMLSAELYKLLGVSLREFYEQIEQVNAKEGSSDYNNLFTGDNNGENTGLFVNVPLEEGILLTE